MFETTVLRIAGAGTPPMLSCSSSVSVPAVDPLLAIFALRMKTLSAESVPELLPVVNDCASQFEFEPD